jgi:P27 family predicted phage terminase small subunit
MGRRGPKPEPVAVKRAKGNPGHRPVVEDSAAALPTGAVSIQPPAWLHSKRKGARKAEGLEIWNRLAPRLITLKLLTPADVETFARYCRNFARWLAMNTILDREGEVYETVSQHGNLRRAHPAYLVADRLERQLLAAENNFGLNPAERQRIFAARAQTGDPAARDLFGGEEKRPADTTAAKPAEPAAPSENPVGFLN